jgi:5'-3' exonuclease
MGIERFFSSIENNNYIYEFNKKIIAEYLYIDFNSIVYITHKDVLNDINYILLRNIKKEYNDKKVELLCEKYKIKIDCSLDNFLKQINDNFLIKYIVDKTEDYILDKIIGSYIVPDKLKYFYIAIDGVPYYSKIVEQKKRRYLAPVQIGIQENIFKKHEEALKKNKEKYLYEKNKIHWSTNNISPGTLFMHKMDKRLSSINFKNKIKELCVNLETYKFSGIYLRGEGEKKIVNDLRSLKGEKSNYVIYSPDGDVIVLSLLLNNILKSKNNHKISSLKMFRHNQQKKKYDIIDVDKFSDDIYNYCFKKLNNDARLKKENIIDDICFIYTIFGNDFVPKIYGINVKFGLEEIYNYYIKMLKNNKKKDYVYLINSNENKKKLNLEMLKQLFKLLKENEINKYELVYIQENYRNYINIKKKLNASHFNFMEKLYNFIDNLKKFNIDIKRNNKIYEYTNYSDFIDSLKKFTKLTNNKVIKEYDFITIYKKYYDDNNKLPNVYLYFIKFDRTINSPFFMNKLLEFYDNNFKLDDYEKEIFKSNYMLDEYKELFNNESLKLGRINIDRYFNINKKSLENASKDYYKNIHVDKKEVTEDYLEGLLWVFDYYYNQFDDKLLNDYSNVWFYKHEKAPLIGDIYKYLDTNIEKLNILNNNLKKYFIKSDNFFKNLEHLMYVSPPITLKKIIPKEYLDFLKKDFYPNMNNVVNNILEKKNNEIDCTGCIFFSKCNLKVLSKIVNIDKFIKEFKKIKMNSEIDLIRNGPDILNIEYKYPKIIKLKDVKRNNGIHEEYINKYILHKKNYESNNLLSEKIKYEYYQKLCHRHT